MEEGDGHSRSPVEKPALEDVRAEELERGPEDEKEEWVEAYPALTAPRGIWALFGKRATLHVEDDTTFSFHVDAGFDPEHGLTVRVRAWKIDPRTS